MTILQGWAALVFSSHRKAWYTFSPTNHYLPDLRIHLNQKVIGMCERGQGQHPSPACESNASQSDKVNKPKHINNQKNCL